MTTDPGRPPPPRWQEARDVRQLVERLWAHPPVRLLAYAALAVLGLRVLGWATGLLASVIVTVLAAYALAFLANPLLEWLERRRVGRMFGMLLILLATLALAALLISTLSAQLTGLLAGIPTLGANLKGVVASLVERLGRVPGAEGVGASLTKYIDEQSLHFTENVGPLLTRLLNSGPSVLSSLSNIVGWLGQLGFVITLALYFMLEYPKVGLGVLRVFPRAWQPTLYQLSEDVSESFGGYIRGQLLLMLAGAILAALGLLALKVPNALALGLLSGLLSLIPYLGIVLASVLAMLQAFPQGVVTIGLVAALYFLINQIQGNVLGPVIMGRTVSLSPSAILIALLVGLALGGAVGAILAVPFATLIKRWTERYWLTSPAYLGRRLGAAPAGDEARSGQGPAA